MREARFGIPSDVKDVQAPIFLELPAIPSRMDAKIEATDLTGLDVVSLDFKVYPATTIFPFLPPKYRKVALKADGVTLIVTPGEMENDKRTFHLA